MSPAERRAFNAAIGRDLLAFHGLAFAQLYPGRKYRPNWHMEAIAWRLQQVIDGGCTRLIINMPPRLGKSLLASVTLPAFLHGLDPGRNIITASYGAELAIKFANESRALMGTDFYKRIYPAARLSPIKDTEREYRTTAGGSRVVTSVGGRITGFGADIMIIDDPLKADDALSEARRTEANEWLSGSVMSRLNGFDGVIIIVKQRLHQHDMTGHALEMGGWEQLVIPAVAEMETDVEIGPGLFHHRRVGEVIDPNRFPREHYDQQERQIGRFLYSAQYQQQPIPEEGEIVRFSDFKRFDVLPFIRNKMILQSWDTASKAGELNDYSVCTTWLLHEDKYYLLDLLRERLEFPDLKERVIRYALAWEANEIILEDKGSGTQLLQQLRHERPVHVPRPIAFNPRADKRTRMAAQTAKIREGRVLLPVRAEWLGLLQSEMAQFPNGKHDDQVDSISQLLAWHDEWLSGRGRITVRSMFAEVPKERRTR